MHSFKCVRWLLFLSFIIFVTSLENNTRIETKKLNQLKTATTLKQFFRDNCNCEQNWNCECCVSYRNNFFNVYQNLCSNLTYQSKNFEMSFNVALNNAVLFSNKFSGNNIPPLCYPLLPPWPILGCIRAHSLRQHDNNQIHACSNATLNFAGFDLLNFRLGCIDFGMAGVELVEPDHDTVNNEPTPEISLETSDTLTEAQTMPSVFSAESPAPKKRLLCHENTIEANN